MIDIKSKWNVNPTDPVTIARLISELEGVSYILDCYDGNNDYIVVRDMLKKYYKLYFKLNKESDEKEREKVIKAYV